MTSTDPTALVIVDPDGRRIWQPGEAWPSEPIGLCEARLVGIQGLTGDLSSMLRDALDVQIALDDFDRILEAAKDRGWVWLYETSAFDAPNLVDPYIVLAEGLYWQVATRDLDEDEVAHVAQLESDHAEHLLRLGRSSHREIDGLPKITYETVRLPDLEATRLKTFSGENPLVVLEIEGRDIPVVHQPTLRALQDLITSRQD